MNDRQAVRYLDLVDRRLFILLHSGIDWKPEYGPELAAIEQELAQLRSLVEQEHKQREEAEKNMKELRRTLTQMNVRGDFDTRTYEHIIIVYLNQEYFGTYNAKSKSFIDLDVSKLVPGRGERVG